jgi:hypothetical protein
MGSSTDGDRSGTLCKAGKGCGKPMPGNSERPESNLWAGTFQAWIFDSWTVAAQQEKTTLRGTKMDHAVLHKLFYTA